MKRIFAVAVPLILAACGCGSASGDYATDTTSVAYTAGREAAIEMLELCTDSNAVEDYLLEFHARVYQTELRDGKEAASNLRQGFKDEVSDLSPELAERIF